MRRLRYWRSKSTGTVCWRCGTHAGQGGRTDTIICLRKQLCVHLHTALFVYSFQINFLGWDTRHFISATLSIFKKNAYELLRVVHFKQCAFVRNAIVFCTFSRNTSLSRLVSAHDSTNESITLHSLPIIIFQYIRVLAVFRKFVRIKIDWKWREIHNQTKFILQPIYWQCNYSFPGGVAKSLVLSSKTLR